MDELYHGHVPHSIKNRFRGALHTLGVEFQAVDNGVPVPPLCSSRHAKRIVERTATTLRRALAQHACDHQFEVLSHEERECRLCGAVEFMPDE